VSRARAVLAREQLELLAREYSLIYSLATNSFASTARAGRSRVQLELLTNQYSSSCTLASTARAGRLRIQLELVARKYELLVREELEHEVLYMAGGAEDDGGMKVSQS